MKNEIYSLNRNYFEMIHALELYINTRFFAFGTRHVDVDVDYYDGNGYRYIYAYVDFVVMIHIYVRTYL